MIGRLERVRDQGVADANLASVRRSRALLATLYPQIPTEALEERDTWLNDAIVLAIARWVRATPPAERTRASLDALLARLTAFCVTTLGARAA